MNSLKIAAVSVFAVVAFAQSSAEAACGSFEVSKGDVKIQSGAKLTQASVGAKICSGDTVIAADQSRAKIKMEDGNELNVSPNSKIVLETYQFDPAQNKKKVLLNVLKGKIRATTREENMYTDKSKDGQANTFQVKTKSAVAGVRGTDFLTSFDDSTGRSEVITFRGKVEVGLLGPSGAILNSVQVGVGQTTVVLPGNLPETPKALPPLELKRLDTETSRPPGNDVAVRTPERRAPASGGSMATGNELSGGVITERGPASDMKIPPAVLAPRPAQPPVPRIPQQVIDAVQKKAILRINVTLPQ